MVKPDRADRKHREPITIFCLVPRARLTFEITRADGTRLAVPVTCRLDTGEEIAYFRAGGLLPMICERLLQAA